MTTNENPYAVKLSCTLCGKEKEDVKVVCDKDGDIDYLWCGECDTRIVLDLTMLDESVPF